MRVAIISAMWKRPEVFTVFAKRCQQLQKKFNTISIVVGSEGKTSQRLANLHGISYIEQINQPLGRKMNTASIRAKDYNPDYVLCLGSDDLISDSTFSYYLQLMEEGYDYIATEDFYFFDSKTKKASYWAGYRNDFKGMPCGAGRALSKRICQKLNWKLWYDEKYSDVLDTAMDEQLRTFYHKDILINLKKNNLMAFDIKSSTNMTPFELWDNTVEIDAYTILQHFDQDEQQKILSIGR
jgi:hypothetical protein